MTNSPYDLSRASSQSPPEAGTTPSAEGEILPTYLTGTNKQVWLTFDDGPRKSTTEHILTILNKYGIKSTFFVLGKNAELNKSILQEMFSEGHRIGNHSYSHPRLPMLTEDKVCEELEKTDDIISSYVTQEKVFRPPYGEHNDIVDKVAKDLGYRIVLWNVDTLDWNATYKPTKWIDIGVEQIKSRNKSIVLAHDIHPTTSNNLESFIERITQLGGVTFESPETI